MSFLSPGRRAVAVLALPLAVGAPMTRGLTYTMTIADGAGTMSVVANGKIAGDNARIDIVSATTPASNPAASNPAAAGHAAPTLYAPGTYYLMKRGGQTFTLVDPTQQKYFDVDFASLMQGMTALVNMEYSDVTVTTERVPGDSVVEGYHTQHWRMSDSHTMSMSILGMHSTSSVVSTSEYYFAPDFKDDLNPFMKAAGQMLGTSASTSAYMAKLQAATTQMYQGMPLLVVQRMATTDTKGNQRTTTMTRRITSIQHADVPASTFDVPAGYQKVESAPAANTTAATGAVDDSAKPQSRGTTAGDVVKAVGQDVASDVANSATQKAKTKLHNILHVP